MNKQLATIVTGGGRGMGKAIALRMSKETAVVIVGRTQDTLAATAKEIEAAGGICHYLVGDVSDAKTAEAAVALVKEKGLKLRNLVCNAGIGKGGPATTFAREDWQELFKVNVDGVFWFVQACLPAMVAESAGNICMISSTGGLKGFKNDTAYVATKHALVGMAKSLSLEYARKGVVVVPICPAFVETDMTRRTIAGVMKHRSMTEADAEALVKEKSPQNRIIPASEVAEVVAFVCSGVAPSLNGNPLVMSGGD